MRRRARFVDEKKCNGCGACWESCPARRLPTTRVIRKGELVVGRTRKAATGQPAERRVPVEVQVT